jgi:heme/copper-type cytochrome/quinol oxidase subunit 3
VLFALVVGVPLVLIVGMGITLAAVLYVLDRMRRSVAAASAARVVSKPVIVTAQPARVAAALSPLSQRVLAGGPVDAGPALGLPSNKLGMWVFLASEVMFFTALIGAFVAFKARGMIDASHALSVPLAGLNTFILIISSFTVVLGLEAIQRNNQTRFILLILATIGLGSVFVGLQGVEWSLLLGEGITPSNQLFGTAFFVLTGFHGAHVVSGILWLITLMLRAFRGEFSAENYLPYELFGLYWHFVDIVWIVLFTVIYLV